MDSHNSSKFLYEHGLRVSNMQIVGQASNKVSVAGVMTQLEDIDQQIALASTKVHIHTEFWYNVSSCRCSNIQSQINLRVQIPIFTFQFQIP